MADFGSAIFEDETLKRFFKNLNTNLRVIKDGKKKYYGLISSIIFKDVMDHFEKEEGEKEDWEVWSDSYIRHMERIGRVNNKTLQFNGRLRNNFKPTNVRETDAGIMWFNNAKTKSGFPYAFAHNEGGKQLPKRDFMWASDGAVEKIGTQTLYFLLEGGL
jgi:hypothetical protein